MSVIVTRTVNKQTPSTHKLHQDIEGYNYLTRIYWRNGSPVNQMQGCDPGLGMTTHRSLATD